MRLISRAELSRLAGVSDMAITKQCRGGLAEACHGRRIDLDHPLVQAFIARHDGSAPAKPAEPQSEPPRPTARPPKREPEQAKQPTPVAAPMAPTAQMLADGPESIEDIEHFADMTLREIVKRFGSMTAHRDWLDMRKKQVDIHEKELKNLETRGDLIPRELVRVHVFGALEELHKRLLHDVPQNLVRTVYSMARSGTPVEEAERDARDKISALLRPLKDKAARALRRKPGSGE